MLQVGAVVQRSLAGRTRWSWAPGAATRSTTSPRSCRTSSPAPATTTRAIRRCKKLVEAGSATVDPDQRRKAYSAAIKLITETGRLDADVHLHSDLRVFEAAQLQAVSGRTAAVLPEQLEVAPPPVIVCPGCAAESRMQPANGRKPQCTTQRDSVTARLCPWLGRRRIGADPAFAQQPTAATRHATLGDHQSAAAMGPPCAAGHLSRPRHHRHRSVVQAVTLLGITAIHRVATGFLWSGRSGLVAARASTSCSATCRATRSTACCGTMAG